jgi:glyoxylase-like metal-dependent hydrolase (beta-lactamase superfamily II)
MACGPLACNTFAFVCDSTKESVIVDPSTHDPSEFDALGEFLEGTNVKKILLTHGHPDHVAGVLDCMQAWPRATLSLHPLDMENYLHAPKYAAQFGLKIPHDLPEPTDALQDRQIIRVGESIELQAVHTPGHAPGHVAFVDRRPSLLTADNIGSVIVGGDLLFRGSVGRTDFPNSSIDDLYASLRRLYDFFDEESIVLTGHTTPTFLKTEKETNPFVVMTLQRPDDWYQDAQERNGWTTSS